MKQSASVQLAEARGPANWKENALAFITGSRLGNTQTLRWRA